MFFIITQLEEREGNLYREERGHQDRQTPRSDEIYRGDYFEIFVCSGHDHAADHIFVGLPEGKQKL